MKGLHNETGPGGYPTVVHQRWVGAYCARDISHDMANAAPFSNILS